MDSLAEDYVFVAIAIQVSMPILLPVVWYLGGLGMAITCWVLLTGITILLPVIAVLMCIIALITTRIMIWIASYG